MFISYNNNDDNECIQVNRIEQNSLLCADSASSTPGVDGANANSQFSWRSDGMGQWIIAHSSETETHTHPTIEVAVYSPLIHSSVTSHSRTFSFIIIISFSIILMTKIT